GLSSAASLKLVESRADARCAGATPRTQLRGLIEASAEHVGLSRRFTRLRGLSSAASLKRDARAPGVRPRRATPRTQLRGLIEARGRTARGPWRPQRDSADSAPRPH